MSKLLDTIVSGVPFHVVVTVPYFSFNRSRQLMFVPPKGTLKNMGSVSYGSQKIGLSVFFCAENVAGPSGDERIEGTSQRFGPLYLVSRIGGRRYFDAYEVPPLYWCGHVFHIEQIEILIVELVFASQIAVVYCTL